MAQKTTEEIRTLLGNLKLDFDSIENKLLNDYLQQMFPSCSIAEDICVKDHCTEDVYQTDQCMDCAVLQKLPKIGFSKP
jgi:hypothetical protein